MTRRPCRAAACLAMVLAPALAPAGETPPGAAVATGHPLATQAAVDTLAADGNAFDAAVAAAATLAVVEPHGSGLGGGGFWLLHRARDGHQVMLDARETAPAAASRTMYQDADGELRPRDSLDGPRAAGIPGIPAALDRLTDDYGNRDLAANLAPAIHHARDGFRVTEGYRDMARFRRDVLRASPAASRAFLDNGAVPAAGSRIQQPELARTLERLAAEGRAGFYQGPVAERLVAGTREAGGLWRMQDLADYRVVAREPVQGRYGDVTVTAAAPPSAGGIGLVTMLNVLAAMDGDADSQAQRIHRRVEAMRRAYRDRQQYLGDPDFVSIPRERLTGRAHARRLARSFDPERATPSRSLPEVRARGEDTTHLSVIDRHGNRVAATLSINYPFGSGFMPPETGVVLNNEMDDFASRPGKANAYGLVGGEANAIAPGKRPLSSMTPTFLASDKRVAVLGSPGGSRIVTQLLLATLAFAEGESPSQWLARARYHHQYLPDRIEHEPGALSLETRQRLVDMGHYPQPMTRQYGDMQVALWHRGRERMAAASDPRGEGAAMTTDQHGDE